MSNHNRLPRPSLPPEDPLDVAALLRARADADGLWVGLVAGDDITPAGRALRMYMEDRRVAWLTVARWIEGVAELRRLSRLWTLAVACAQRATLGGARGPVYETAGDLLSDLLERIDAAQDYEDDDDDY